MRGRIGTYNHHKEKQGEKEKKVDLTSRAEIAKQCVRKRV